MVIKLRDEKKYYEISKKASQNIEHPVFREIDKIATNSNSVLDLGCGDGTRLALLKTNSQKYGVDISYYAIRKALKQYPKIKFIQSDISKLPFGSETFDLIYSCFVFEHLNNPEKIINEAIRVLKRKGIIIIAAPNYGSPNRRSPNSVQGKIKKLIFGFLSRPKNILNWEKVNPQKSAYFIDSDTTIEPYLGTLISFLEFRGLKILKASSLWELDSFSVKQLIFRILGILGISPFKWWGPQILIEAQKI